MVMKLILANVVAYLLQGMFNPSFTLAFRLDRDAVVGGLQVWRLVTYMFLHGSFSHIFWNMFILWLFGGAIEAVWGSRSFLRYYIFCGIGAGVASLVFYDSVVGASGAIFGLYLAYAMMFPDNKIYLYFLIPVKAKWLVLAMVVFQLAAGLSGPSGIAYFAHLGGMAAGLFFFRDEIMRRLRFNAGPRRKWEQHINERRREEPSTSDDDNIDSILDKISAKGYDHLSTTEKRILENYSRKRKDESD